MNYLNATETPQFYQSDRLWREKSGEKTTKPRLQMRDSWKMQ